MMFLLPYALVNVTLKVVQIGKLSDWDLMTKTIPYIPSILNLQQYRWMLHRINGYYEKLTTNLNNSSLLH